MFVQSNDWIFATAADGLALYSEDGTPISGDVTSLKGGDSPTQFNDYATFLLGDSSRTCIVTIPKRGLTSFII